MRVIEQENMFENESLGEAIKTVVGLFITAVASALAAAFAVLYNRVSKKQFEAQVAADLKRHTDMVERMNGIDKKIGDVEHLMQQGSFAVTVQLTEIKKDMHHLKEQGDQMSRGIESIQRNLLERK